MTNVSKSDWVAHVTICTLWCSFMLTLSGCTGLSNPDGDTADGGDDPPIFTAGTDGTPVEIDCGFSVFLDDGSLAPTQLGFSGSLHLTARSELVVTETAGRRRAS